jgi:hypothetical protein
MDLRERVCGADPWRRSGGSCPAGAGRWSAPHHRSARWGVQKPARYIGCEDGAHHPPHGRTRSRGCSPTPTPTRSACPTRACRSSTRSSTSATTPWPSAPTPRGPTSRPRCGPGVPLFSVDTHRPAADFDVLAFNLSAELVYTNVLNCIDLAGVPVRSRRPSPDDPSSSPAATAPTTPSRSPTSSTSSSSATARRSSARSPRSCRVEGAGTGGRRARRCCGPRHRPGVYVPSLYDVHLRRRPARRSRPATPTCPGRGREAHRRRPGRVALPEAPAGAAHRGRPRPPQRRGVPRLHPRLPVLPGRHDHPAGARAPGRPGPHHGATACAAPATTRWPHLAVHRRLQRHRGGRRGHRRPTRPAAGRCRVACPACGSTPSPSASPPRSSGPAAPASPSPPRPARGGCARSSTSSSREEDLYGAVESPSARAGGA